MPHSAWLPCKQNCLTWLACEMTCNCMQRKNVKQVKPRENARLSGAIGLCTSRTLAKRLTSSMYHAALLPRVAVETSVGGICWGIKAAKACMSPLSAIEISFCRDHQGKRQCQQWNFARLLVARPCRREVFAGAERAGSAGRFHGYRRLHSPNILGAHVD